MVPVASDRMTRMPPFLSQASTPSLQHRLPRVARACDGVTVPASTVLRRALAGLVVDVDQAEALGIAVRPLEVVEQAPDEVALDARAVLQRACHGRDVSVQ